MQHVNIVELTLIVLTWIIIGVIAFKLYKQQSVKPQIWIVPIVIYIGLFSFTFSFQWTMFDTLINLAILPLGVWIIYMFLRNKEDQWNTYRKFAWLGFWGNYLFLIATLLTVPIHHLVYSEDQVTTYLSNIEDASLIFIHPSAKENTININTLQSKIHTFESEEIFNYDWYEEVYINQEPKERFPYLITNTSPKWGSGIKSMIYIERDGKGLLVTTPQKQFYFRSDQSILEEEL